MTLEEAYERAEEAISTCTMDYEAIKVMVKEQRRMQREVRRISKLIRLMSGSCNDDVEAQSRKRSQR